MGDDFNRVKYLLLFLLGVFWIVMPMSSAAEEWPIKEFKVIRNNPSPTTWADVQTAKLRVKLGTSPQKYADAVEARYNYEQSNFSKKVSLATAQEIEKWLHAVAQAYEDMGFLNPHYGNTSMVSGQKKFLVYVYPFYDAYAAYNGICASNPKTHIRIDSVRSIKPDGSLTAKAYQDIAHELFHAVQHRYDLFSKSCNVGEWITEGTAEAVGIEMARKLYPKKAPYTICQIGKRFYNQRLYTNAGSSVGASPPCQEAKLDYQALSFWQFLGEYAHRKFMGDYAEKGYLATEEFVPPDFRYLHNFFSRTHSMGSPAKEYVWLNKVLRQNNRYGKHQFGIILHTAYSRFVGTFASYWKEKRMSRYPGAVGGASQAAQEEKWMKWIFGACAPVIVNKGASIPPVTLAIGPVAAQCLKMTFNGFEKDERVGLTFFASGDNQSIDQESLAISTDGGKKIIRRHPAEQVADRIGKFPKIAATTDPQYFIVSNVAKKAATTKAIEPVLTIVQESISTNLAKEKKDPEDPDPSEKQEREHARKSRSWKGQAWQDDRRTCKRPFEAAPCGRTTNLHLSLVPDTAHLLDTLKEPSMTWERKFRMFDDVVQDGGESFVSDYLDDLYEIQQQDGWEVNIIISQIQPGFTGTISNAHIQVAKAVPQRGSYKALGPWAGSCTKGYRPATGQVMIEEFSKYVLKGTFSAQLVDSKMFEPCQTAPIVQSDGGPFSITEIGGHLNIDIPPPSDEAIIDRTIEDTNELLPDLITDDLREHIKEKAKQEREKQRQEKQENSSTKNGTGSMPSCDCQCHMEKTYCEADPTSRCCQTCEPVFLMCNGNKKGHSDPVTADDVREMRKQYEAYLDAHGMAGMADIKQQMMQAFDEIPTAEEKRMFIKVLPEK